MTSAKGNTSDLPPAGELAAALRDGATAEDLAITYGVAHDTLARRISSSGYSAITGLSIRTDRPVVPPAPTDTGSLTYVGGGDWDRGLPTDTPATYRRRPTPTGLDWDAIRDNYVANGGVETPEIFTPDTVTKIHHKTGIPTTYEQAGPDRGPGRAVPPHVLAQVALRYAKGESASRLMREFGVSFDTIRKAVTSKGGTMRQRGALGRKLSPEDSAIAARRYAEGESAGALMDEFGCSRMTITRAVIANGGTMRTPLEAAFNRSNRTGAA